MAEGGGLLNRCTVKSRTGGSNPPLSAIFLKEIHLPAHKPKALPALICVTNFMQTGQLKL